MPVTIRLRRIDNPPCCQYTNEAGWIYQNAVVLFGPQAENRIGWPTWIRTRTVLLNRELCCRYTIGQLKMVAGEGVEPSGAGI